MDSDRGNRADICVVGGGYMGAAVALGLVKAGASVLMIDKISPVHKASRANFGLVWSQSKGVDNRSYSRWSEKAAMAFESFADWIEEESGINVELRIGAGLVLSIGEEELAARKALIQKLHTEAQQHGEKHPSRLVDRKEVQELVGQVRLGEDVLGGSFSSIDGDVNPLLLLKAMRKVFIKKGGRFFQGCSLNAIEKKGDTYRLDTSSGEIQVRKIVMAAGLGNLALASMLGKSLPIVPQKGQILVTERVSPFLSLPISGLRQTVGGSVMIGYTQENTGFDVSTTVSAATRLSRRALQIFPSLSSTRVVRSWAGLRILTRDGVPVYDKIDENTYVLATHSCVTLASVHASHLPQWILGGKRPKEIQPFALERFDV